MATPEVPGYTLGLVLGHGSSGRVWSAVRTRDRLPCAIKVIALAGDQLDLAAREAAVLQRVSHDHVVALLDVVRIQAAPDGDGDGDASDGADALALVLELAGGGCLAAVVSARGHLTMGEVVTALSPVAAALADLHAQGLVHADLSPGNIVFTGAGRPMISDLGVARIAGDVPEDAYGTAGFIAPEVLDGGLPTPASDAYSIAALTWFALVGTAPESGAIRGPLAELATGTPDAVVDVVTRALAGEPSLRPTCSELALALFEGAAAEPVDLAPGRDPSAGITYRIRAGAHEAGQSGGVPAARGSTWRRALVLAALAGAVVGGTVGVGLRVSQQQSSETKSAATLARTMAPRPTTVAMPSPSLLTRSAGQARRALAGPFAADPTVTARPAAPQRHAAGAPSPSSIVQDRSAARTAPAQVLGALVAARARAWRRGTASILTAAHAGGSPALRRDQADLAAVERAHAHYAGLEFHVRDATVVSASATTAEITADVDRSAYQVVRGGHEVRQAPAERQHDTAFELRWTEAGWRIADWS